VHPGDLARGCSDLAITWVLCCAGAATGIRATEGDERGREGRGRKGRRGDRKKGRREKEGRKKRRKEGPPPCVGMGPPNG